MKLLSISFANHDTNFSYYDGESVRYAAVERILHAKRGAIIDFFLLKKEIERVFSINLMKDVDKISVDIEHEFYVRKNLNLIFDENWYKKQFYRLDPIFNSKIGLPDVETWFVNHHYAHSLSGWMLTDKNPDVSFVIDGSGNYRVWSVFKHEREIDSAFVKDSGSIGHNMMFVGDYLRIVSDNKIDNAGKVMALQSYGNFNLDFFNIIKNYDIYDIDKLFDYNEWYIFNKNYLVGQLTPLNWINTVHYALGKILIKHFKKYAKPEDTIFYSGGVALNVVWNTMLRKEFPNLIIAPHSTDEGLSLGGIEFLRRVSGLPKFDIRNFPYCQSDECPENPSTETIKKAASLLSQGKVVGWYQGHGEIGPRALGNRSILFDPRVREGHSIVNEIKLRETYRPFGASILSEFMNDYFDLNWQDPYMLYCRQVKSDNLPSITHIDGSCRVQSVGKHDNPVFRNLLEEFNNLTGCPILLNTSFNLAGKPLASYKEVAEDIFYKTKIDAVFIGNKCLEK